MKYEDLPTNNLPTFDECMAHIEAGTDTPLHRFIYNYDDADVKGSAYFLQDLELLINYVIEQKRDGGHMHPSQDKSDQQISL